MRIKELLTADDAVSPVIGVILMVAITVILAAVIATFVLGLGEQISDTAPSTSFEFDYNDSANNLTAIHRSGTTLENETISISSSNSSSNLVYNIGNDGEISAGDSITITGIKKADDDTVDIIWSSAEGDQSSTLQTWPSN